MGPGRQGARRGRAPRPHPEIRKPGDLPAPGPLEGPYRDETGRGVPVADQALSRGPSCPAPPADGKGPAMDGTTDGIAGPPPLPGEAPADGTSSGGTSSAGTSTHTAGQAPRAVHEGEETPAPGPVELLVCVTCRMGRPREAEGPRPGA